jgi:flagellar motor switch protein FliN/FliY
MPTNLQSILRLEVPVIVQIANRAMLVEEVRALVPGAILELPKDTEDDLDILVNHQVVAGGRAVKVGENFGVRVTCVGRVADRIKALGRERSMSTSGEAPADIPAPKTTTGDEPSSAKAESVASS